MAYYWLLCSRKSEKSSCFRSVNQDSAPPVPKACQFKFFLQPPLPPPAGHSLKFMEFFLESGCSQWDRRLARLRWHLPTPRHPSRDLIEHPEQASWQPITRASPDTGRRHRRQLSRLCDAGARRSSGVRLGGMCVCGSVWCKPLPSLRSAAPTSSCHNRH